MTNDISAGDSSIPTLSHRDIMERVDAETFIFDIRKLFCWGAAKSIKLLTPQESLEFDTTLISAQL